MHTSTLKRQQFAAQKWTQKSKPWTTNRGILKCWWDIIRKKREEIAKNIKSISLFQIHYLYFLQTRKSMTFIKYKHTNTKVDVVRMSCFCWWSSRLTSFFNWTRFHEKIKRGRVERSNSTVKLFLPPISYLKQIKYL